MICPLSSRQIKYKKICYFRGAISQTDDFLIFYKTLYQYTPQRESVLLAMLKRVLIFFTLNWLKPHKKADEHNHVHQLFVLHTNTMLFTAVYLTSCPCRRPLALVVLWIHLLPDFLLSKSWMRYLLHFAVQNVLLSLGLQSLL